MNTNALAFYSKFFMALEDYYLCYMQTLVEIDQGATLITVLSSMFFAFKLRLE